MGILEDLQKKLKGCPWCNNTPIFIITPLDGTITKERSCEIKCIDEKCKANPWVCYQKGTQPIEAVNIWNSYHLDNLTKVKKTNKDIRKFNDYLSKNELRDILIDAKSSKEVWNRYLPTYPYLSKTERIDENDKGRNNNCTPKNI